MPLTRSATRRRNEVTPVEVSGPAAFRVVRANQFRSRARRRWDMLRALIRRMNILSHWAWRTAIHLMPSTGRVERHIARYHDMGVDVTSWPYLTGGVTNLNLRPIRGEAPRWAADRAQFRRPLP